MRLVALHVEGRDAEPPADRALDIAQLTLERPFGRQ